MCHKSKELRANPLEFYDIINQDVCGENPCDDGSVCLKMGGVTCLSREGCRAERLRECVDLETLTCTVRDDNATVTAEEGKFELHAAPQYSFLHFRCSVWR